MFVTLPRSRRNASVSTAIPWRDSRQLCCRCGGHSVSRSIPASLGAWLSGSGVSQRLCIMASLWGMSRRASSGLLRALTCAGSRHCGSHDARRRHGAGSVRAAVGGHDFTWSAAEVQVAVLCVCVRICVCVCVCIRQAASVVVPGAVACIRVGSHTCRITADSCPTGPHWCVVDAARPSQPWDDGGGTAASQKSPVVTVKPTAREFILRLQKQRPFLPSAEVRQQLGWCSGRLMF
jgi:hypothetical protein